MVEITKPPPTIMYVMARSELRNLRSLLPKFKGHMVVSGNSSRCLNSVMPDSVRCWSLKKIYKLIEYKYNVKLSPEGKTF